MDHVRPETGLTRQSSLRVLMAQVVLAGIRRLLAVTMAQAVHLMAAAVPLVVSLVVVVMDSGEMENTLRVLQMHVWSVISSVSSMTRRSSRPVLISRNMMTSLSKHPDKMSPNLSTDSPTPLWMTILSVTLSSLTTKFRLQCRSTRFPL